MVFPDRRQPDTYLVLDGRLKDRGESEVFCLLATDGPFTYDRRISRLAPIQEHFMIVRATDSGGSSRLLVVAHRRLLMPICRAGSPLLVVAIHGFAVQSSIKLLIPIDFLTCFLSDNERSCARQVGRWRT